MYGPLQPFNQALTPALPKALGSALSQYCAHTQASSAGDTCGKSFLLSYRFGPSGFRESAPSAKEEVSKPPEITLIYNAIRLLLFLAIQGERGNHDLK